MVNFEFISSIFPTWVIVPFLFMILSGLLSTVDSNLCAAASMMTDTRVGGEIKQSRLAMLILLAIAIGIANIPRLTVTHLFLFYGTLRASTLLPTIFTLLSKKLTANGVFAGVLASLCVGLPIFAYGNIENIAAFKTAGSLITVLLSGVIALVTAPRTPQKGVSA
jgi:Na+/proline symporter